MCSSPYDYCISAYVDRDGDYRGCDPFYRAGSVFWGTDSRSCDCVTADYSAGAGQYGIITPVSGSRIPVESGGFTPPRTSPPRVPVGIPQQTPQGGKPDAPKTAPRESTPDLDTLINQPRQPNMPIPVIPPAKPNTKPPVVEPIPEVLPFSPNDEVPPPVNPPVAPPSVNPPPVNPPVNPAEPFSIEELRRLEPAAEKIEIISIEDAAADTQWR